MDCDRSTALSLSDVDRLAALSPVHRAGAVANEAVAGNEAGGCGNHCRDGSLRRSLPDAIPPLVGLLALVPHMLAVQRTVRIEMQLVCVNSRYGDGFRSVRRNHPYAREIGVEDVAARVHHDGH